MANSYKPGKWNGTLQANLVGDASKTTPTLGDDYDSELKNLKKAQSNIQATIRSIKGQVTALKNHAETGKFATSYLASTEKRLDKVLNALNSEVASLEKAVNNAQKEEWTRIKQLIAEWQATQNQG